MRKVEFRAIEFEGRREGWMVYVDDVAVCAVSEDALDVSDSDLDPLWEALGVEVTFDSD